MEILAFLTYIALILLIGLLFSLVAAKIRVPRILLLIIVGIILNKIPYPAGWKPEFPTLFIAGIGLIALIIIIFDSTSRLKIKQFDDFSISALKLTLFFFFLCLILLSSATHLLFGSPVLISLIFASLMAGTAPEIVFSLMKVSKNKVMQLLEIEALINTPIIVLFPFLIIDIINNFNQQVTFSKIFEQLIPFTQQIVTGIGAGIVIGMIIFKVMKRYYSETYSPLAVITAALLTYTLAENLGGNGVLAVTTMGVFFGHMVVKEKETLQEYASFFSHTLEILVFVLVGFTFGFSFDTNLLIYSLALFLIFLMIRYAAIYFSFKHELVKGDSTFKERLFMTLNCPKGIGTVVVILLLKANPQIYNLVGMPQILDLALIFVLYSIIISSVVALFSKFFLGENLFAAKGVHK